MKKEKTALIAFILALIVTIPELPAIINYIKGVKELGEMLIAFLVRIAFWIILIKALLFIYKIVSTLLRKLRKI